MEQIYKLQPDRCLALRGFDSFAAAAALHSATDNSFIVSGTFRDPADFAVLLLWDADNYYEHPSIKYLPDFDFSGLVLNFNLQYTDGVQPIDSPKYNWIDWATLDCALATGNNSRVRLWDYATLAGGTYTPASATFTLTAGPNGPQTGDRLTLWFQNIAFDYTVPQVTGTVEYPFYAAGNGTLHSIEVNDREYAYTENNPNGDGSGDVANALIALVNANGGDPDVVASVGSVPNAVLLTVLQTAPDAVIAVQASDGNIPAELGIVTLTGAAAAMASLINAFPNPWQGAGGGLAVTASSSGANVIVQAARYGYVNTNGVTVSWSPGPGTTQPDGSIVYQSWSDQFPGLAVGDTIWLNGIAFQIAGVDSPMQVTVTEAPASNLALAQYVAPRGGRDGNLFTVYSIAQPPTGVTNPNLNTQASLQLTGGNSTVTWNVSIDFSALGIDQLRQCWLTFAPSLASGAAYSDTEWAATFTNWTVTGGSNRLLKIAGPGSVRIEENSSWCKYQGAGWSAPPGDTTGGFYSKYAAMVSKQAGDSVTISYMCAAVHDLYIGTSLYSDRGTATVVLDGGSNGVPLPNLNCELSVPAAVVTRRLLAASVPAGSHSVTLTSLGTGPVYFDFLEAAVASDWPGPGRVFTRISPALDYDTDHTYKLSPARVLWTFAQLGFQGPVNEYMGVFWWNQRTGAGAVFPQTTMTFTGTFVSGDAIFLTFNADASQGIVGDTLGKSVFPADTPATIAAHFADYLNEASTVAWASVNGNILTMTSRSPASAYALEVVATTALTAASTGVVTPGPPPAQAVYPDYLIDTAKQPTLNRAVSDWHADFYSLCAAAKLEVTTAGSMELVLPPSGFAAFFANGTPVTTATDVSTTVGVLTSTQCAVGGSLVVAYQTQFYLAIAALQAAAGLTPSVQFGEFLWWFFGNPQGNPNGMAYYDPETTVAALAQLGRPLYPFLTPNDNPNVNGGADTTFLRDRLRDHVGSLVSALRTAYPTIEIEVLFPYDVNYPSPIVPGSQVGGQLNYAVNLPAEWKQQNTSGLDRIKVEALQFTTAFRNLNLANQAVQLMPNFGWPRKAVRYLAPVFGTFLPWQTEVGLGFSANLNAVNLWAYDHISLYNLDVTNLREP